MIRANNGLEFFLYIKLLKLTENGKTAVPPCELIPQICVNLYQFIETWRGEETNLYEAKEAVREALGKIQQAFDCPLGWLMTAERQADFKLCLEAKHFQSNDFLYSPDLEKTEIDLSFINGWLFEEVKIEDEDFSDLYFDETDRAEINRLMNQK